MSGWRWTWAALRWVPVALLLGIGLSLRPAGAEGDEDVPSVVPVAIEASFDEQTLADTGAGLLELRFTPAEDIARAYRVELRLVRGPLGLLDLDHAPEPPTTTWKKDVEVRYEIPVPLPLEAGLKPGDELTLCVGFFDTAAEKQIRPDTDDPLRDWRKEVVRFQVPDLGAIETDEKLTAVLERARALASEGKKPAAWQALEMGLRRATEDEAKERFRDALLALGHFRPSPITLVERQIVEKRIADERRRYLRLMAGRHFDKGRLFAALRLLEAVGGSLAEEADEAVIGAVNEAERAEKDILDIQLRILAQATDEDKERAEKAEASLGTTPSLLRRAGEWVAKKQYARARILLRTLSLSSDRELAQAARQKLDELDAAWLADTPPEEAALVEEAMHHPAFERLDVVATHKFLYIGPAGLVGGIPDLSRLRFDLAYVFVTDLFGRLPNPAGDRVTVYFKELWDFGGGVGGGKTIDIGNADPDATTYRVDNHLLYHELTHCVDDTNPILAGYREGLGDVGAIYAQEALGQVAGQELAEKPLEAFRKDYLDRDLEYWRIPNYGPSAGFFLHFLDAYAKRGDGFDWKPYRRFFRDYRAAPVKDGREPNVARALAYHLVQSFGQGAFDDLIRFRLPLVESDREAIAKEMSVFSSRSVPSRWIDELSAYPNSPLPRDVRERDLLENIRRRGDREALMRQGREELGIVYDWWTIGPFRERGVDPGACVFPPQQELDLTKEYPSDNNMCKWRKAGETGVVGLDPTGWVSFNFSYMNDTASYALTHLTVPEPTEAFVHVRPDDEFELFLNDEWIDGYQPRGLNGGDYVWWRGPAAQAPDAMRLRVSLRAGRNRLLLKIRNGSGPSGFVLAITGLGGRPIEGLAADLDPPTPDSTVAEEPLRYRRVLRESFRSRSTSFLDVAVGRFKVVRRVLEGQSSDGAVAWRKYTVRPGFPKDSPSNLAWLKPKVTEGAQAFRLTMHLVTGRRDAPKLLVTFMGEGETDGLSGWNLILHPRGDHGVGARLERYDRLVYQAIADLPERDEDDDDPVELVLAYERERLTVTLGGAQVFADVPIRPIPGRHRIGFATWGDKPGIAGLELETAD